ncbi:MAG: bifunctional folylpolyglutamate synthase/dihydrofolate synthase [Thermoplasmata archaeon]|nr:MAG: bifunctional folylpolyglutamate synthase/dihydrofolate synthase [Thermoplasmata archaeon]
MNNSKPVKHSDHKTMDIIDYDTAIEYLYSLELFGIKLGLDNITRIMEKLGNPHTDLKFIHVAGTNGKGSVCAMLSSVLAEAGYKVGLYSSPHLRSFRERIAVNSERIPRERVVSLTKQLQQTALEIESETEAHPTYFEITTAMALKYFQEVEVDIAVMEVGMGGRFDATNIITPLVSVITDISLDHTEYLGEKLEKISFEKAGIIKDRIPVITSNQKPEAMEVIENISKENSSELFALDQDFNFELIEANENGVKLNAVYNDRFGTGIRFENLSIPFIGRFQAQNCAVALAVVAMLTNSGWDIPKDSIYSGLQKVSWPARVQVMQRSPTVILDCSHNPSGISYLVETIEDLFEYNKIIFVIGVVKEKARGEIVKLISALNPEVIAVKPASHRALEPEVLQAEFREAGVECSVKSDVLQGVEDALKQAGPTDLVCITGSFYTAGAAMEHWQKAEKSI